MPVATPRTPGRQDGCFRAGFQAAPSLAPLRRVDGKRSDVPRGLEARIPIPFSPHAPLFLASLAAFLSSFPRMQPNKRLLLTALRAAAEAGVRRAELMPDAFDQPPGAPQPTGALGASRLGREARRAGKRAQPQPNDREQARVDREGSAKHPPPGLYVGHRPPFWLRPERKMDPTPASC